MASSEQKPRTGRFSGSDKAWIAVQLSLQAIAGVGGAVEYLLAGRSIGEGSPWTAITCGLLLMATSAGVLVRAARDLAGNLTAAPTPVENGVLVDRGIYGIVRHPMYLSVLLGVGGYGLLLGSRLVIVVLLVMVPFFAAKALHEERLLRARIPGYTDYTRRVRSRFIPYIV